MHDFCYSLKGIIYFPFLILDKVILCDYLCVDVLNALILLFDASRKVTGIPLLDFHDYAGGLPFLFIFLI